MNGKVIRLTSSEISSIWTEYMNESLSKYMLQYMLQSIQDQEIKPVVQQAYDFSVSRLEQLHALFAQENFCTPDGFSEQDVNMHAPWLFTDAFCLTYVNHLARIRMTAYSGFVSASYREDVCDYFSEGLSETNHLYRRSLQIALEKGINARHPFIEVPDKTDRVGSKKYMSGLNPFHEKRPLNAIEISHLYLNVVTNSIGTNLCTAFAQTSPSKEVQEYMLRGKEVSQKHLKIFADALLDNDMETPHVPDVAISDSTTETFSDKMMMFQISLLMTAGIGNYAMAAAASQRSDLVLTYERLSFEVARLAKSGADIMIKHKWLEQPPMSKNRSNLARNKEEADQ